MAAVARHVTSLVGETGKEQRGRPEMTLTRRGSPSAKCAPPGCTMCWSTAAITIAARRSDIEDRFVCRVCGKRGADIRLDFEPTRMGTG